MTKARRPYFNTKTKTLPYRMGKVGLDKWLSNPDPQSFDRQGFINGTIQSCLDNCLDITLSRCLLVEMLADHLHDLIRVSAKLRSDSASPYPVIKRILTHRVLHLYTQIGFIGKGRMPYKRVAEVAHH